MPSSIAARSPGPRSSPGSRRRCPPTCGSRPCSRAANLMAVLPSASRSKSRRRGSTRSSRRSKPGHVPERPGDRRADADDGLIEAVFGGQYLPDAPTVAQADGDTTPDAATNATARGAEARAAHDGGAVASRVAILREHRAAADPAGAGPGRQRAAVRIRRLPALPARRQRRAAQQSAASRRSWPRVKPNLRRPPAR